MRHLEKCVVGRIILRIVTLVLFFLVIFARVIALPVQVADLKV